MIQQTPTKQCCQLMHKNISPIMSNLIYLIHSMDRVNDLKFEQTMRNSYMHLCSYITCEHTNGTSEFHKRYGISLLVEKLSVSQKGLCCIELVMLQADLSW
jgi:hypothetical protein